MSTTALFTKVNDRWRFEGFLHDDYSGQRTAEFVRQVEREIKATKDSEVPTQTYQIVPLH